LKEFNPLILGFKQAKDLQAFIKEAPPLSPDREILKGMQ
jgi:hypothetical protein